MDRETGKKQVIRIKIVRRRSCGHRCGRYKRRGEVKKDREDEDRMSGVWTELSKSVVEWMVEPPCLEREVWNGY